MPMPLEAQVFITAGRRVQTIKQAPEEGGIPKSGTEIVARIGGIPPPSGETVGSSLPQTPRPPFPGC
ncbi:TPA: hypothetical protein ACLAZ6_000395 [Neisseria meningitidis]|uniref:hypothetical protein n=1 Tax=Neisseria lactamica TaxID=486 RepID=UPI0003709AF3|nr:hypothetical protein [Neisseria lactamica]